MTFVLTFWADHLQPKGLHPESAKNVKAKNLDQTIETREESEKEGVQGKEVYLKIKFMTYRTLNYNLHKEKC